MKNIFYFILGICMIILTSATTVSVMTIKPSTPINTVVFYEYNSFLIPKRIESYIKKGYILKSIYGDRFPIVVLEKY